MQVMIIPLVSVAVNSVITKSVLIGWGDTERQADKTLRGGCSFTFCFYSACEGKRILRTGFNALAAKGALLGIEFRHGFKLVPDYGFVFAGVETLAAMDAAAFALTTSWYIL